jgi:hypothetical protein
MVLVNGEDLNTFACLLCDNSKPQKVMPLGIIVSWGFLPADNASEGGRGRNAPLVHAHPCMLRHFNTNKYLPWSTKWFQSIFFNHTTWRNRIATF